MVYKRWPLAVRIAVPLVTLLVVIGIVLFSIAKFDTWRANRSLRQAKANVNVAMQNVNAAKAVVSNDAVNEAVAVEQFKDAVNTAVALSNATDQAKEETKQAAANYAAAVNANRPLGTTEDDLDKKLRALDQ